MGTKTKGVTAKLFLGLLVTPESKAELQQNKKWQEGNFDQKATSCKFQLINYQSKEYLGVYIDHALTTNEFRMLLLYCLDQLKHYLPSQQIESAKLTLFPQLFIS